MAFTRCQMKSADPTVLLENNLLKLNNELDTLMDSSNARHDVNNMDFVINNLSIGEPLNSSEAYHKFLDYHLDKNMAYHDETTNFPFQNMNMALSPGSLHTIRESTITYQTLKDSHMKLPIVYRDQDSQNSQCFKEHIITQPVDEHHILSDSPMAFHPTIMDPHMELPIGADPTLNDTNSFCNMNATTPLDDLNTIDYPKFNVYFMNPGDATQIYVQQCNSSSEHDWSSCSYSNETSSNSSSSHFEVNRNSKAQKNFKKYPLRSDKSFNVVPRVVPDPQNMEEISLRALSIGPDSYFKSDYQKITDKIKATSDYLRMLSTERSTLEKIIRKFKKNSFLPLNLSQNDRGISEPAGDSIKTYYYRTLHAIEFEYISLINLGKLLNNTAANVFMDLIVEPLMRKLIIIDEDDLCPILNDYLKAMNNLKTLNALHIIVTDNCNQIITDEVRQEVINTFDDMSFAIRQCSILFWTLKEAIGMIPITSTQQLENFRYLFLGS